jgi:regulatory protein
MRRVRPSRDDTAAAAGPEVLRERALGQALRALARGPKSRSEIEAALARRGHDAATIAGVVARLDELGYLDDALVADAVARGAERKHLGSRRVARTLGRRGVAREVVERTARASGATDLERARAFVARRFPGGIGRERAERQRATRLLFARGFPGDVIRQALGIDVDVDVADAAHDDDSP